MSFWFEQLKLIINEDLDQHRYDEVMENLSPKSLSTFLQELGLTASDARSLLIKTLCHVEDNADEFSS